MTQPDFPTSVTPPSPAKRPHEMTLHGDTRVDPWFWLNEKDNPEVIDYLKAENTYTETMLKDTEPTQGALFKEMRSRIKEDDNSVPEKDGDYYYYSRYREGDQYSLVCRRKGSEEGPEEILLDCNELAKGKDYFDLGVCEVSPDHQWLAFSTDTDGSERFIIQFKHMATGEILDDRIENTYYGIAWGNDNSTLWYAVQDENQRPTQLWRHRLNTPSDQDVMEYEEKDPRFFLYISKSSNERFVYLGLDGNNMSEIHFKPADDPTASWQLIQARQPDLEYDVDNRGELFYIHHNAKGAKDFMISTAPIDNPGMDNWTTLVEHTPGRLIEGIGLYEKWFTLYLREQGTPQIQIHNFASGESHSIDMDEPAYALGLGGSREWNTDVIRFSYTSMTTPATVYDYNMITRERTLRKQAAVLGPFNTDDYRTERLWAHAEDGTQVPMSVVYHKNTPRDGSAPLFLYGYGSYGSTMEATFGSNRLSLLNRGVIFVIAHIRGGKEMGWDWYEKGKLAHKMNTFTDFIACAEHLIAQHYTSAGYIVACGGSAGGLLMGTVMNLKPELFGGIIAHVPFVDTLTTMLDDSLPLTTMEYNEWGNPNEKDAYERIKAYSPYDNVEAKAYPPILITAGLNDPRVTYWEPAKWCVKLRELRTDDNPTLLKTHMDTGHAGASGRWEGLKEVALDYAFVLKVLNISV